MYSYVRTVLRTHSYVIVRTYVQYVVFSLSELLRLMCPLHSDIWLGTFDIEALLIPYCTYNHLVWRAAVRQATKYRTVDWYGWARERLE